MMDAKDSCSFQEVFIREREEMSIFHVHSEKKQATRFDMNYSFAEDDHEKVEDSSCQVFQSLYGDQLH